MKYSMSRDTVPNIWVPNTTQKQIAFLGFGLLVGKADFLFIHPRVKYTSYLKSQIRAF